MRHRGTCQFRKKPMVVIATGEPTDTRPDEIIPAQVVLYRRGYRQFIRLMDGKRVMAETPVKPGETPQEAHDRFVIHLGMTVPSFVVESVAGDDAGTLAMPGEVIPRAEL